MLFFSLILVLVVVFVGLILTLRQVIVVNAVSATKHLEDLNRKFTEKEAEVNSRMERVEDESRIIVERAGVEAEELRERIIKEAEKQKEEILKDAAVKAAEIMEKAEKSRRTLLSEIEIRINRGAAERAYELIQENLPEKYRRAAHETWSTDLLEGDFLGMERLHKTEDVEEVKVQTAFPLTSEQRNVLSGKIKDIFGKAPAIKEESSPALIAGMVITAGSLVFDGSLLGRIKGIMDTGGEDNVAQE